ncbi:MAG TPA: LysE family transporter [Syntrophales bacterium]|jgi:threonine/homoserine/homoserine lactone efflux protein|nr:LysE family transporter [Syntrophales bacterium]HPX55808.1 LysE family transporter [Syntrophales bacterium]HQA82068.1 LysE family transporter [Syntrophales bacterium]
MTLTLVAIFASSFLIALSGALMPGPLLTVTVSESPRRGAVTGPLMILGHGILELGLVIALLLGLAPILKQDAVFISISLAGGGILIWMAVSMFRSLPNLYLDLDASPGKPRNLILSGIILSLVNPYWTIWWASIGLGYIMSSAKLGAAGIISFFAGHILADFIWYSFISYSVSRGRRFLSNTLYRGLIGGCASFLLIFACCFLYSGLLKLQ